MKWTSLLPLTAVVCAFVQTSAGWCRDDSGHLTLDLVLLVALAAGLCGGPLLGTVSGLLGGLMVGAPAQLGVPFAILYGLAGLASGLCRQRDSRPLRLAVVAMAISLAVAAMHSTALHLGWTPLLASLPMAGRDAVLAFLVGGLRGGSKPA